jgi:putative glycosyltransferase
MPNNLTNARLMTRRYVSALTSHREREISIGGLWVATGFQQVPIAVAKRPKGRSSYTLARKLAVVTNHVTSYSNRPLWLIFALGSGVSAAAVAAALVLLVRRFFFGATLSGFPILIVSIWAVGGLTLFGLGIIAVYLAKIFLEVKQRPYPIVREVYEDRSDEQQP